jgi:GPI ethanolamine phosphate transferase 2/3 subunit F
MTSMEAQPRKIQSTSSPIEVLHNDTARLYAHLHPALLLVVFFARFNALVVDPVSTLLTSLIPLSVLQLCYVVICLPMAGSTGSQAPPKGAKPGQRRKAAPGLGSKIVVRATL